MSWQQTGHIDRPSDARTLVDAALALPTEARPRAVQIARPGTDAQQERVRQQIESGGYMQWLLTLFPKSFTRRGADGITEVIPPAAYHHEHWEWFWPLQKGIRPRPLVEILPRGGGKSTGTELGCIQCGCRDTRRYVLYVSRTQDRADEHVQNIAQKLESKRLERFYPEMGNRLVGKFGSSRGWRRDRVRTLTGFTVDALGVDSASRGAKVEDQRPDLIVLDDIDAGSDSDKEVRKLVRTVTRDILPTGSDDCAVIFAQNLVHDRSIAALLCGKHPAPELFDELQFLLDRRIIGPIKALDGFFAEQKREADGRLVFKITQGTPTWAGMGVQRCQQIINTEGYSSFLAERQHEPKPPKGGIFSHLDLDALLVEQNEVPERVRTVVTLDPAVTSHDDSDACGVQVDSLCDDERIYREFSWEQRATPEEAVTLALRKAVEYGADTIIVETDQGGDLWEDEVENTWEKIVKDVHIPEITARTIRPKFVGLKAGSTQMPKTHRASLMVNDYERDMVRHVRGTHMVLHAALERFPKTKPHDLVDACYWGWNELKYPSNVPMMLLHGAAKGWVPSGDVRR